MRKSRRQPLLINHPRLRKLVLQAWWLILAVCPWVRRGRQRCGFPISQPDPNADPICGRRAPFAFYCRKHDPGIGSRLTGWWRWRHINF